MSAIDTSDATATANDILLDKTAYVNNEKLIGNIPTYTSDVNRSISSDYNYPNGYHSKDITFTSTATREGWINRDNRTISPNCSESNQDNVIVDNDHVVLGVYGRFSQLSGLTVNVVLNGNTYNLISSSEQAGDQRYSLGICKYIFFNEPIQSSINAYYTINGKNASEVTNIEHKVTLQSVYIHPL